MIRLNKPEAVNLPLHSLDYSYFVPYRWRNIATTPKEIETMCLMCSREITFKSKIYAS